MKSFEERKTEIFRRSKERIAERKKIRKRVLAVTVPIFLALGVAAFELLPVEKRAVTEQSVNDKVSSNSEEFLSLTVTGSDGLGIKAKTVTDSGKISDIYYAVLSFYESKAMTPITDFSDSLKDETKGDGLKSDTANEDADCTITFECSDGTIEEFILNGYELYNVNGDERITLDEKELIKLRKVLK